MAINVDFRGFHSILVDVDALGKQHPALDAALELATRCHAKVKIVDVVWDVPDSARAGEVSAMIRICERCSGTPASLPRMSPAVAIASSRSALRYAAFDARLGMSE